MKYLVKMIKNILIFTIFVFNCTVLNAEIVINEFFLSSSEEEKIPQYIELYNTEEFAVNIEGWSIKTELLYENTLIESSINTEFSYSNELFLKINAENLIIEPQSYFLISSNENGEYAFSNELLADIEAFFLLDLNIEYGIIKLINENEEIVDIVEYDIENNWPLGEEAKGRSLRLHNPILDNSIADNWSLSPKTERSIWLYDSNDERYNFGSPKKENSFRINNVQYLDQIIDLGGIHIISGDVNNVYNANNNYEDNNYDIPLDFSWQGTFNNVLGQQYKLIIQKTNVLKPEKHGFNNESYADSYFSWDSIIGIDTMIYPQNLEIDQLEVGDYSWTVELTKGNDTIYSDQHFFKVDASDYGIYGCVDDSMCDFNELGFSTCPTTATDDTLISNHPIGCIPGIDCFSAINFKSDANIHSNTCHYISLSIPAFVMGDADTIATVPIYLKNDSLAEINDLIFTLNYDYNDGIILFEEGSVLGTIISELDTSFFNDDSGEILVSLPINSKYSSFSEAGVITNINFYLSGEETDIAELFFSNVEVSGGYPKNTISFPVTGGEIVISQPEYEIFGSVTYFAGDDPFEIPNVELDLDKNYDGVSSISYKDTTNDQGYYRFSSLSEGNYELSFSKNSVSDCEGGDYITGSDISKIARFVSGYEEFSENQIIVADVSLDGTVSSYDASLLAQYKVDFISDFNNINTHWIFKPVDPISLPNIYAELVSLDGNYSIHYQPLVLDDDNRNISAFRLGDIDGNYCSDALLRKTYDDYHFEEVEMDYQSQITFSLALSNALLLEGIDIEIAYDKQIFEPVSINFESSKLSNDEYKIMSNLNSDAGTIKAVVWAIREYQNISGIIGEVKFKWKNDNKTGNIWLKEFLVNNYYSLGGIAIFQENEEIILDGISIINNIMPNVLVLDQNYPNPFNPKTTISWFMPTAGEISIDIYNVQGQLIQKLYNGVKMAGKHVVLWNAVSYPSGVYYYRLTMDENKINNRMLLLK